MSHENYDFETSFNLRFSALAPILHQYFGLCFRQCCIRQASFVIGINRFIFSEKFCEKVLFYANRGHLQPLKVCVLKLLCPSQLHAGNINTEFLLAFYKSNSRVFWSHCRALIYCKCKNKIKSPVPKIALHIQSSIT